MSSDPLTSLNVVLNVLPSLLQATIDLCQTHATDVNALKVLFSSLILICKLFYSLNFQVITVFKALFCNNTWTLNINVHKRPAMNS